MKQPVTGWHEYGMTWTHWSEQLRAFKRDVVGKGLFHASSFAHSVRSPAPLLFTQEKWATQIPKFVPLILWAQTEGWKSWPSDEKHIKIRVRVDASVPHVLDGCGVLDIVLRTFGCMIVVKLCLVSTFSCTNIGSTIHGTKIFHLSFSSCFVPYSSKLGTNLTRIDCTFIYSVLY